MQAECEAEHSKAWSLLLKSAKTFSEGFKSGLAMGVLERQLVNNATVYIVKLRAGMNPQFESPTGPPQDLAVSRLPARATQIAPRLPACRAR